MFACFTDKVTGLPVLIRCDLIERVRANEAGGCDLKLTRKKTPVAVKEEFFAVAAALGMKSELS